MGSCFDNKTQPVVIIIFFWNNSIELHKGSITCIRLSNVTNSCIFTLGYYNTDTDYIYYQYYSNVYCYQ